MVLITSSTVSAILSAGIISAFTFLLFLVGYVLQQQSVNSLREAIRQPPPAPPKPTLPPQFRLDGDETEKVIVGDDNDTGVDEQIAQFLSGNANAVSVDVDSRPPQDRLAYILALSKPSDLCSAALFAQTLSINITSSDRLILLYPSAWETAISSLNMAALTFMRSLHDAHPVIFHPVEFVKGWEAASVHSHLLGELQRTMWDFDRLLYLKTPGFVVDIGRVEAALKASSAKKMWTPMTGAVGDDPEVLLWERKRGLLMPRGDMRSLAGNFRSNASLEDGEEDVEPGPREPNAYMIPGDKTETDRMDEMILRYQDGLQSVCKGRGLLEGEEDRIELR